jgi:hypothetical protein
MDFRTRFRPGRSRWPAIRASKPNFGRRPPQGSGELDFRTLFPLVEPVAGDKGRETEFRTPFPLPRDWVSRILGRRSQWGAGAEGK